MNDKPESSDEQMQEPENTSKDEPADLESRSPGPDPTRLTLREASEAAKDPDHPRHQEALRAVERATRSIQKSLPKVDVSEQIKQITDSITPLKEVVGFSAKEMIPRMGIKIPDLTKLVPKTKAPDLFHYSALPKPEQLVPPPFDSSGYEEALKGVAEARAEALQREIETLAFMRRVAEGIDSQNEKLATAALAAREAEKASAKRDRRNAWIAGLTLFATVLGIGVSVVITLVTRP